MRHFLIALLLSNPLLQLYAQSSENPAAEERSFAVLSVHLGSRKQIIFNSPTETIVFKNISRIDSIITKRIETKKPIHLFFGNVIVNPSGNRYESGNLLLLPGDTVVLGNDGRRVITSTGFSHYIDSLLSIPTGYLPLPNPAEVNMKDTVPLWKRFSDISNSYLQNQIRIAHLAIESTHKDILSTFNAVLKARQISAIRFEQLQRENLSLLDSVYYDMQLHIDDISPIASGFNSWTYDALIRYSAFRRGVRSNDFWVYFDKADTSIENLVFYKPHVISALKNCFKNVPETIDKLAAKRDTVSLRFADTVYRLAYILSETKKNYRQAKTKLDAYSNGAYSFLLTEEDELHRESRSIHSLPPVNLFTFNDKKVALKDLLNDQSANITVLDFWASWCVPCIAEYPSLMKVKAALSRQSIRFVAISIDTERDKHKWIEASKRLQTFNKPFQYRLENAKHSPINNYFNLYSIPRYIVIDKQGKILEETFYRPGDPAFQRKLQSYLRDYEENRL